MRYLSFLALALALAGCATVSAPPAGEADRTDRAGPALAEPSLAEPVLRQARNVPVAATMGGAPDPRYALYSLREGRLVLAYTADARELAGTTAWDIGLRGTEIIANAPPHGPGRGGVQLLEADFDALAELPADGYAPALAARWFDYGEGVVTPAPGRVLAVRTADGRYAKLRIESYYRDAPAAPQPGLHTPRYYTFAYAFQPDGSRRVAARPPVPYDPATDQLRFTGEVHLRNVRQLTFGGNNAEAYWSPDGRQLIFQSDWDAINPQGCDQQFVMNADGSPLASGERYRLVSTGRGRTTCGYFIPDYAPGPHAGRLLYASTHAASPACPAPPPAASGRYVWPIHPSYDIYVADADGANPEQLVGGASYDAEPTVSPDGRYVVFTSTRSGDLDLWRLDLATGELLQLTDEIGYDGGAFFSPDSRYIVWRASRPTGDDAARYRANLARDIVEPGVLQLYVAEADGSNARRITDLPGANWAPFFHPSGQKIIFSSNFHTMDRGGREFDLFMISLDGSGLTRITHSGTFDAFPMFSPDGTRLVFASNRRADRADSRDTNVFVADWVETPEAVDRAFETRPPVPAAAPAP
ncbi:MAG: hypothetical protein ACK41D_10710 [Rubricoccaceae bacterium]